MGSGAGDVLSGGRGNDILFGDFGTASHDDGTGMLTGLRSIRLDETGADVLHGGPGDDVLVGGGRGDLVDGESGADLVFGDRSS